MDIKEIAVMLGAIVTIISSLEFLNARRNKLLKKEVKEIVKEEVKPIKEYVKKEVADLKEGLTNTTESQLEDMRIDLANKYYVYNDMEKVPDYLAIGFWEKCERYFKMGGNTYIHPMYEKSKNDWKIAVSNMIQNGTSSKME